MKVFDKLIKLDGFLIGVSDVVVEFLWVWFGLRRSILAKGPLIIAAFIDLHLCLQRHEWGSLLSTGLVFVLWYTMPNYNGISPVLQMMGRLILLGTSVGVGVATIAQSIHLARLIHPLVESIMDTISVSFMVWFLYVITQGNNGEKKARRHPIPDIVKMFGTEWIPEPQKVEG